jgi:glycerol dehydrogenase-like iron-containing ADH family enzyme
MSVKQLAVAPGQVLVGPDALGRLGEVVGALGRRVLVVTGRGSWRAEAAVIAPALGDLDVAVYQYDPDCTPRCAADARAAAAAEGRDVVVGVGGGKALDLAKLVGDDADLPVVTVPTSAATCAAWTALGNFYDEAGGFSHGRSLPRSPAAAVVDTALIARAPARLLASGLADSLAKWVETSVSVDYATADAGTRAAWTMAKFLYDEIRDWGEEAYADARAGRLTPTLARAVEANVCLAGTVGGLGGERCRSVAAHAVANALTTMPYAPGAGPSWHGEKVAFGIVTQRVMEGKDAEAADLAGFFAALDVPITLTALGHDLSAADLARVADHVCGPRSTAHHLPFPVTPERVLAAIAEADRLGAAAADHRHPSQEPQR